MRARARNASLLLAIAAAGCGHGDQTGAPGAPLAGSYVAIEVTSGGAARPLVPGTQIVVSFEGDQMSAELGCGRVTGRYSFERTRLVVDEVEQAEDDDCDPGRQEQARSLAELVTSRPQMLVSGDEAVINDGHTAIVLRDRDVPPPDEPLLRTAWVHDGGAAQVVFEVDGAIGGGDVCGDLGGGADPLRYELDADQLVVRGTAGTACAEAGAQPVRALLAGPLTWSVEVDRLTLRAPDGTSATFRAAG